MQGHLLRESERFFFLEGHRARTCEKGSLYTCTETCYRTKLCTHLASIPASLFAHGTDKAGSSDERQRDSGGRKRKKEGGQTSRGGWGRDMIPTTTCGDSRLKPLTLDLRAELWHHAPLVTELEQRERRGPLSSGLLLLIDKSLFNRSDHDEPSTITIQRDSGLDVSAPKHGKIDANNDPHVGGNQWAGGTGGRDTAGLGGKEVPTGWMQDTKSTRHRIRKCLSGDLICDVSYQVSQAEKDAVPDEVRKAAREMGEKAFKERLKEINMSEYDAAMYERFSSAVSRQVQSLRIVLDSLQAKGKERQWLKNQALGELDDAKIIDGLTGEKAIYKRRGELDPELGSPQQKPKRLRVLADVSGSMYRFNGVDRRLERSMEAVCMVMEGLENYEHKFKYDIVGHSGDGYDIELVRADKVPKNNKERLKVLKGQIHIIV
ncbi:hypothetical protein NQZ68_012734 [Dissostichus eleginoides]|nr:hypothetical protein NQZ68_012734 [Dissostichus eleginoides]